MRSKSRLGSIALCTVVLIGQTGCFTKRQVPVSQNAGLSKLHSSNGQPISGYTTTSGGRVDFEGYARVVGDSIVFTRPAREGTLVSKGQPGSQSVLPLDSVSQLDVRIFSPGRTGLAVLGSTVLVLAAAVGVAVATKESCPFIYSWNGSEFLFDGEPYGGATMRGLERTDWSELEHLKAVGGRYRLLLTNEVDETQHTNRLELLVVDHAPGSRVVMDATGRPHAFTRFAPLSEARDAHGADLTHWLRHDDRVVWHPDLDRYAAAESLVDTREHLTLRFDRPEGVDTVYLVTRAATGQWGSHMIRSMLGLRGDQVGAFYAAIDSSAFFRDQLLAWNRREELFDLGVEVHELDGWRSAARIPGGGPFVLESRAIPVALGRVAGPTLELRVHPPIGFWGLNAFRLGWGEVPVSVQRLAAHSASSVVGADVREVLRADDDHYLDFPTTDDRATLEFAVPSRSKGQTRTVFAETRGWYQIHLHRAGGPDLAAIERLTLEPGWAVREALREYREFRRTGVLAGTAGNAGRR